MLSKNKMFSKNVFIHKRYFFFYSSKNICFQKLFTTLKKFFFRKKEIVIFSSLKGAEFLPKKMFSKINEFYHVGFSHKKKSFEEKVFLLHKFFSREFVSKIFFLSFLRNLKIVLKKRENFSLRKKESLFSMLDFLLKKLFFSENFSIKSFLKKACFFKIIKVNVVTFFFFFLCTLISNLFLRIVVDLGFVFKAHSLESLNAHKTYIVPIIS